MKKELMDKASKTQEKPPGVKVPVTITGTHTSTDSNLKYVCLFPDMLSPNPTTPNNPPPILSPPGEAAPTSSTKKATQGPPPPPPSGQRPLTGKLREAAAGGQETPDGCQKSCICTSKLSDRECWQHWDLHTRGSDKAMRKLLDTHTALTSSTHTHTYTITPQYKY